jgi:hypothetical protein
VKFLSISGMRDKARSAIREALAEVEINGSSVPPFLAATIISPARVRKKVGELSARWAELEQKQGEQT